jgi:hypothetical protein
MALGVVALSGACCEGDVCVQDVGDGGPDDTGDQPLFTEGCAVDDIRDENGQVCAACAFGTICGDARPARCERSQDELGDACRYCETDLGEVLYNSCFDVSPVSGAENLRCEGQIVNDPDQPEGTECTICTDESGLVTEQRCGPVSDECHDVVDQGRDCVECTRDGAVVALTCEQPDILPRSCEVYENELGRCIDCYGDDDQLLTHFCTENADPTRICVDAVSPDGLVVCSTCTDANGALLEQFCDQGTGGLEQCAFLEYSEQTCVVCVDEADRVGRSVCDAKCDDPASCEPPPECFFSQDDESGLCRTCPTSTGFAETQCVFETNLSCGDVIGPDGQVCFECVDNSSGAPVYASCENFIPPTCGVAANAIGEECQLCVDSSTQAPVYGDCPSQTCGVYGTFGVFSNDGLQLFVDNQPAVTTCTLCGSPDGDTQDICTLRSDCGPVELIDPDASCADAVVFQLRPKTCGNPWEAAGYAQGFFGFPEELMEILAWSLDVGGVAPIALQRTTTFVNGQDPECVAECCARGDAIELVVRPGDAPAARELFGDVILPCNADADCAAGDVCRLDGSCG